jgi:hypothetical protein
MQYSSNFVNGMVAPYILCHSGTINRHYLNGAAIMNVKTIGIDLAKEPLSLETRLPTAMTLNGRQISREFPV